MSFYENNLQRVRSNILGLFNSEHDSDDELICSKKNKCDLKIKDMIQESNDENDLKISFNHPDTLIFGSDSEPNSTSELPEPDSEPDSPESYIDDPILPDIESDSDEDGGANFGSLDDISDSELENDIQNIKNVERDLKIMKSNYFADGSIPVEVENDDSYVSNLAQHDIDNDNIYIKVKEKPYKIEINSANPDEEEEYIKPATYKSVDEYKNFEAFYEHHISKFTKQLYIFNKIISNNLIAHPFLSDIVSEFRKHVVDIWCEKFTEADGMYDINFPEPKKWIQRAESILFDFNIKQSVIEYMKLVGSLIVLFDAQQTFKLNEHLYKNILNKAIEPLDLKKYNIDEFLDYYARGKNTSKVLIQDIKDNLMLKQNIEIMNLDINLYNRIFHDTVKPIKYDISDIELGNQISDYFEHTDINNSQDILKQPIIYVDPDTHKVYIFDYNKLNDKFNEKQFINTFTDKPFEEKFVEQCMKKMKNHLLCNYCKDNICDTTKTLKTIYQDPNYGPLILKFCSVDCFSDIEWKPKVLRNAII